MEKIKIQITWGNLFFILLICFGLLYFFSGMKVYFGTKNAVSITDLGFSECSDERYVYGNIDTYVVKEIETFGGASYSGVSTTCLTSMGTEYNFYTIPIANSKYIRVMVKDKSIIESLEKFVKGRGKGVYFEGEVVEATSPLEYAWYSDIAEFQGKVLEENIQSQYVIKEISFSEKKKKLYIGAVFLIVAMGGFKISCCTESFIVREKSENKKVILDPMARYNRKNELEVEKRKLENLQQRLEKLKKGCIYRALLIVCGMCIVMLFYLWEVKIIGIIIIILGAKGIWRYFINSPYRVARYIARVFSLNTLWEKIEICEYRIQVLSNSILKDEK